MLISISTEAVTVECSDDGPYSPDVLRDLANCARSTFDEAFTAATKAIPET